MPKDHFRFKQFTVQQDRCAMKVSTDGVLFGAWVDHAGAERILDIGTGTGVLALIAAQRNAAAMIDAVEIDAAAAQQAKENFSASPWAHRLRVLHADVRVLASVGPFDLIICNPPYYAGYSTAADERVGIAKHGEVLLFPDLLQTVDKLLAPNGRFAAIIPLYREQELIEEALQHGLSAARHCTVQYVAHRPAKRVLLEFARQHGGLINETLTLEATGPFDYTPGYRRLISDLMPGF